MTSVEGYFVIQPAELKWIPSKMMKTPNADFLERTGSEILGARLWSLPPKSANTLHRHPKAAEFYFVVESTGRMRVGDETITVPKHGGVLVGPKVLRQAFNDTDEEVLCLIIGAPEKEFGPGEPHDMKLYYPVDPKQLPKELDGLQWPPP
jgi:mannose-6-phosphate isomerase-like protein (cupin superfamily)